MGHEVTTFVRDPAKLPDSVASRVSVKTGNVLDESQVDEAVQGQDAVVIALGTRNDLAFNFWERSKVPERFLELLADHGRMLDALKASNKDWIAVLPPHISDEPGSGDYIVEHGKGPGRRISKNDLGHFMVSCLSNEDHVHQLCGLCNKPIS